MSGTILTLNAGSSSLKFAVFSTDETVTTPQLSGKIAGIGTAPVFGAQDAKGATLAKGPLEHLDAAFDHEHLIKLLLPWLAQHQGHEPLVAVGHRVVHGGKHFEGPVQVTDTVLATLETLIPLAPLHQPHNLAAIRAVAKWEPDLRQIACFDTSFHQTQGRLAKLFALPRALSDEGIIRYGFHGLSYDYIASQLPDHLGDQADGRVVVAHLGNGASMCAIKDRESVATSMGFTALDGLMMGRRCGTLDPGVILYLMQAKGMTADAVTNMLYNQSGLFGVSGISNDMHVLQNSSDPHAFEAIDLYCYRAASSLAGLIPSIGGLDAIVFTAGIGENSSFVRKLICEQMAWLGVAIDETANDNNATLISTEQSKIKVLVIPTNEELVVAKACHALLS